MLRVHRVFCCYRSCHCFNSNWFLVNTNLNLIKKNYSATAESLLYCKRLIVEMLAETDNKTRRRLIIQMPHTASNRVRQKTKLLATLSRCAKYFTWLCLLRWLKCHGIFHDCFITDLLLSHAANEF